MSNVLSKLGKTREAAAHQAAANFLLGQAQASKGNFGEAKGCFRQSIELDGAGTIEFAEQVCTLSASNSLAHPDLLTATCAEAGRFADATSALQKAIALAEATGQTGAVIRYRSFLEHCHREITRP